MKRQRVTRLLQYLVAEQLAGRGTSLKAYTIATAVLNRSDSFDAQRDPIVRIEMAKLRQALEHYYLTDGLHDPVRIEIPKGTYVPRSVLIEVRNDKQQPQVQSRVQWDTRRLAAAAGVFLSVLLAWSVLQGVDHAEGNGESAANVLPEGVIVAELIVDSDTRTSRSLSRGLTERIAETLLRMDKVAVFMAKDEMVTPPDTRPSYLLSGRVREVDDTLATHFRLVERTTGRVIWAECFHIARANAHTSQTEVRIANQVANVTSDYIRPSNQHLHLQ
ncbi:hypothetical protein [Aestuariivirga sp.]|uniref:hypothetical protein n=1 Tax=Aestuariivirga sp. TaxID=2650926 RepID=UPI003919C45E